MTDLNTFKKVSELSSTLTFADIWRIYDSQFDAIRSFLLRLGDKYKSQVFTNSTDRVIEFESDTEVVDNIFVFYNGSLQVKDRDYEKISATKIQLLFDREYDDEIIILSINSPFLHGNLSNYISELERLISNSEEARIKAEYLLNRVEELISSTIDGIDLFNYECVYKGTRSEISYNIDGIRSMNIMFGGDSTGSSFSSQIILVKSMLSEFEYPLVCPNGFEILRTENVITIKNINRNYMWVFIN